MRHHPGQVLRDPGVARPGADMDVLAVLVERGAGVRHPVLPAVQPADPETAELVGAKIPGVAHAPAQPLVIGRHQFPVAAEHAAPGVDRHQRAPDRAAPGPATALVDAQGERNVIIARRLDNSGELRPVDLRRRFQELRIGVLLARILVSRAVGATDPERIAAQKRLREGQQFDALRRRLLQGLDDNAGGCRLVAPGRP